MPAPKNKKDPKPGDRVRKGERTGTVIHWHKDGRAVSVLPDDRPRSEGSTTWSLSECEITGHLTMTCPICGEHHWVYRCPANAGPAPQLPANPPLDGRLKPLQLGEIRRPRAELADIEVDF